MTKLLLIRHGQSVANLEKFFAGSIDSPLTELGLRQAQITADYITENYQVDRIYASDLQRAYVTGKTIADRLGLDVTGDRDLREIFAGDWEGKTYALLPELFPESYSVWLTNIGYTVCDGGESVAQLQTRVLRVIRKICRENPESTVVVATHATPIRTLQCFCQEMSLEQMKDVAWVSNASVTELICDNDRIFLGKISYDAHLGNMTSVLPDKC